MGKSIFGIHGSKRSEERFKGAFDSFEHEHLPRTKYDITVDETSNKPGEQAFEVRLSSLDIRDKTSDRV